MKAQNKGLSSTKECYFCGGKLVEKAELIIVIKNSIVSKVKKCTKCSEGVVTPQEYEKVRKDIHPGLLTKIKRLFKPKIEFVDLFDGRLL